MTSTSDSGAGAKQKAELRDYLAAERTFLAWVRTGLALMGFGFVVARFGLFLAEFQRLEGGSAPVPSHQFSLFSGTALIAAGIGVNIYAAWSHAHLVGGMNRGDMAGSRSPRVAVMVAALLALVGAAMAIYLLSIRQR